MFIQDIVNVGSASVVFDTMKRKYDVFVDRSPLAYLLELVQVRLPHMHFYVLF